MTGSSQLQNVLSRLKRVQRSGNGYVSQCPAHDDRQPSLSVCDGDRKVTFNCHSGCSYDDILRALGMSKADVYYEPKSVPEKPQLRRTAIYTYRNADETIFARKERYVDDFGAKTFRWSRPDPERPDHWIPGGNNAPLYRLPELIAAPPNATVVIVEGERDSDRLASLGFVVTTTPSGAGAKWRDADTQHFAGRRVAVISDDDEPGRKKAQDTARALDGVAAAVGVVPLPNPNRIKGFDSSDFLDAGGSPDELRALIECFDEARLPTEVIAPSILERRVIELWESGGPPKGIYPGWTTLAKHYRPKTGQITIATGPPNAGKSSFLDHLIINTSCADDGPTPDTACARWKWVVFSAEMFPPERHVAHLLQKFLNKPFSEGKTARITRDELRVGMSVLREYVTVLNPTFGSLSLDRILDVAAELNARTKQHALLLDPFNVINATSRAKGESEIDFINNFLARIRSFAQSEAMHVVVVAHPTKPRREPGDPASAPTKPYEISGSAHWFNHADALLSVWRDVVSEEKTASGEVEIHVSKIRFQPECGTLGMVKLFFDKVTTRYLESPRYVPPASSTRRAEKPNPFVASEDAPRQRGFA